MYGIVFLTMVRERDRERRAAERQADPMAPRERSRSTLQIGQFKEAVMHTPTVDTRSPRFARKAVIVQPRLATVFSAIIAVLASVSSAGGLFWAGLYRDNRLVTAAFRGNDLVTLLVAVPGLVIGLLLARRGSRRGQLIWMGMLAYMLYNYVFYLYGAVFNRFFLLYVALVSLSIVTLIISVFNLDAEGVSQAFDAKTPVKWIAGYMVVFALLLGGMWIAMSLSFVASGQVPAPITQTGHPTGVVFATDLSLLVPGLLAGGLLLCRRRPWGFVLSNVILIKACTYGPALVVMSAFSTSTGSGTDPFLLLWVVLTIGCLLATGLLLVRMGSATGRHNR
jgi:hypothetical protein